MKTRSRQSTSEKKEKYYRGLGSDKELSDTPSEEYQINPAISSKMRTASRADDSDSKKKPFPVKITKTLPDQKGVLIREHKFEDAE